MAQTVYSGRGLAQENRRLVESLRRSNKLLSEANEELRKAARARAEFMADMSHELRTPLSVIIGFSELMLEEIPGKINEEQTQSLNDILRSGKHLLNMINNILDLSKILKPSEKLVRIWFIFSESF